MSNFENFGTIQFSSSRSTSRGLCPKNFEKRAHPIPEVTEPSSSLSACILRYIRLRLLASLSACALIFLLSQRSVERVPQAFFTL